MGTLFDSIMNIPDIKFRENIGKCICQCPSIDDKIYHSTSFKNMLMIIKKNGLYSRWQLLNMQVNGDKEVFSDTADSNIIYWRKRLGIENMIPFHFKTKTPYDYAVYGYNKSVSISDMVVIAIDKHKYDKYSIVFTAHPLSNVAEKYYANSDSIEGHSFWKILDEFKDSNPFKVNDNDVVNNDKRQICMAEYDVGLSYIPLDDILEIHVQTQEKADILLAADKRGILKDKIIIGDKRYLI